MIREYQFIRVLYHKHDTPKTHGKYSDIMNRKLRILPYKWSTHIIDMIIT